jgi:DNA helicase MCM8
LCIIRAGLVPPGTLAVPVRLHVRLQLVGPLTPLRELRAGLVGKLVSVRGSVVRVSGVRPMVLRMAFACTGCGGEIMAWFSDGKYQPPVKCTCVI